MRECGEYEIPLWKFLNFCHGYTERVAIKIVADREAMEDKVHDTYLTENAFNGICTNEPNDTDRLIKYYKDVPLWNLHIEYKYLNIAGQQGHWLTGVLVANCHYADAREGYLAEKDYIRKVKRKEYNQKRKKKERQRNEKDTDIV